MGNLLSYETPDGLGIGSREGFKSAHGTALATMLIVAVATACHCLAIWTSYAQIRLLERIKMHVPLLPGEARQNDQRMTAVVGAAAILTVAGMVLWLIWLHRAYRNLQPLNGRPGKRTPGWAVGGFFIPFYNLAHIPKVMTELWNESDPAGSTGGLAVSCWFIAWIAGGVVSQIATTLNTPSIPGGRPSIDSLISMSWLFLVNHILAVVAGSLAVWLMWGIDDRQRRKSLLVRGSSDQFNSSTSRA